MALIPDSPSICTSLGSDNATPTKLEHALSTATALRLKILPIASCDLFIGVTRIVVSVPLSFSPAIASGANAIHPLNAIIRSNIGNNCEKICAVLSLSDARSYMPASPELISNLLIMLLSYSLSIEVTTAYALLDSFLDEL